MIYNQPKTTVVMYLNYPNGVPYVEQACTERAIEMADTLYLIAPDYRWIPPTVYRLDPEPFERYVRNKVKRDLKPIHYADYLAYYSLEVLGDVYGIYLDKVLKIDADYFITSKYQLRNLFNLESSGVGIDNGYNIKYKSIPQTFKNVHLVYRCRGTDIRVTSLLFRDAVDDYFKNNHYTATGPSLLNRDDYPTIPGFVPFTSDPCHFTGAGKYIVEIPHGALGYHVQSSLANDLGLGIISISINSDLITLTIYNKDHSDKDSE